VQPGECVEGLVDELGLRLRILDLLELGDALLELHSRLLQLRHLGGPEGAFLLAEDEVRILEDALHQREHVERVGHALYLDARDRVDEPERERVVERKVFLKVDVDLESPLGLASDDARLDEALQHGERVLAVDALLRRGLVRALDDARERHAASARSLENLKQHAVRRCESRF
jgi:hypothetical protein